MSIDEAADMLERRRPVLPNSLVVTFDDGYRNQLSSAASVLKRYGAPCIVYLVPGHMERRQPFWFDRLDYALQTGSAHGRVFEMGSTQVRIDASSRDSLRESYRQLREAAKSVPVTDDAMVRLLEGFAAELETASGRRLADSFERDDWSALLTPDEVRAADPRWISFGSHTVDHVRLGHVPLDDARDQIARSKAAVENITRRRCDHLCYPDGSFSEPVARTARECGYRTAVTALEGLNKVGADLMTLRRINLATAGPEIEMLATVSGISVALSALVSWLRGRPIPTRTYELLSR